MKDGTGDLDFGEDDEDDATEETPDVPPQPHDEAESDAGASHPRIQDLQTKDGYPYFLRRNKVSDKRDKRIEVHLAKRSKSRSRSSEVDWPPSSTPTRSRRPTRGSTRCSTRSRTWTRWR